MRGPQGCIMGPVLYIIAANYAKKVFWLFLIGF